MMRRICLLIGVALLVSSALPTASGAQAEVTPYELTGTGSWAIANQMNAWAQILYPSKQGLNLGYLAKGSRGGRGSFARGEVDFAISGRPLNEEDLAKLAERKATAIEVPISVGSMAMLMSAPYPGLETFTPDPLDPEEGEGVRKPYTDNLRFPARTLALIFLDNVFNNWLDPDFLAANSSTLPPGSVFVSRGNLKYPEPVVRSEGSSANYYLQQVLQKYAPKEFGAKLVESQLKDFVVTESWPFLYTGARSGGANAGLVGSWRSSKGSDSVGGGVITPTSNSEAKRQIEANPNTQLFIPAIENGAGDFIVPNSATISKAVEQGDGVAMAGMNAAIPGAYPFTWINNLYAPGSGLGIDATNALVTFARYAVTRGQAESVKLDEGVLPPKLVAQALTKIDTIVSGNCTGSDRKIIAAPDGGPFWPTGVALPDGLTTPWPICAPASSPAPAVTIAPPTAPAVVAGTSLVNPNYGSVGVDLPSSSSSGSYSGSTGSYSVSPYADTPIDLLDTSTTGGPPLDAGASPPEVAEEPTSAALISATLPMGLPDDGRGSLDRLTTMLLGAAVLVLGRSFARRVKVER